MNYTPMPAVLTDYDHAAEAHADLVIIARLAADARRRYVGGNRNLALTLGLLSNCAMLAAESAEIAVELARREAMPPAVDAPDADGTPDPFLPLPADLLAEVMLRR